MANWLSLRQTQALPNAPDTSTKKGLRGRAMLAILLGGGLRRFEVAALTLGRIEQRDNRRSIIDLVGKPGRARTIPVPMWVKGAIDAWTSGAGFSEGAVLRRVSRGDQVQITGISEKVAYRAGVPESRIGFPFFAAYRSGAYARSSGVY